MDPRSRFSLSDYLEALSKEGYRLEVLQGTVDFEYFRAWLVEGLGYGDGCKEGRAPFDPLVMLKPLRPYRSQPRGPKLPNPRPGPMSNMSSPIRRPGSGCSSHERTGPCRGEADPLQPGLYFNRLILNAGNAGTESACKPTKPVKSTPGVMEIGLNAALF